MNSEILLLVSKGFSTSVSSHWMELRNETDFFDVTLACEGNTVKAHRVILSACSPVLKELIIQTQHPHPVLYLRGVSNSQINALLDFIYKGEVNVARDEVNDFLNVAKELKIKGLTLSEDDKPPKEGASNNDQMKGKTESTFSGLSSDSYSLTGNRDTVYFEPNIEANKYFESQIKDDPLYYENEYDSYDIKPKVPRPSDDVKDDNQIKENDTAYNEQISKKISYSSEVKQNYFDIQLKKNFETQIKIDSQYYENKNVINDKKFKDYKICQYCDDKVNKDGNDYKNHLRKVHGHVKVKTKLCCSKCFEVKEDYKALKVCLQKHKTENFWENQSEFKCNEDDCIDVTYNIRKSLVDHKRKHHGMDFKLKKIKLEKYPCMFCKKLFFYFRTMKVHEKIRCLENPANSQKRKSVNNQTNEYKICQFCNESVSKNGNDYKNHLEVVHGHVNVKKSLCCPKCFEIKADYKALRACIQKHKIENFQEIPSEFKCTDCVDVTFNGNESGRKSFLQHKRKYHGMQFSTSGRLPKEFTCKFCTKLFINERNMSIHEEIRCSKNPANSHIKPKGEEYYESAA